MVSAAGHSHVRFDEAQEKVNFGMLKMVGHNYWEHKEHAIAR